MSFRALSRRLSFLSFVGLVSAPAAVSAEVLWRGDFETGDLSQWGTLLNPTKGERKNINVVMMPVHGGTRAGEVVIHPDDLWEGNNHNRVELHYDAVAARTAEGQTTYFSFYFRLPANAQTTNDIAYWETANSYQQSMAFWVQPMGGGTQLSFRTNHPSGMTHYNGMVSINAWHQLAMQILWSENASTGRVTVWLDGQKIVNEVAAKTKPDSNRVFIQMGYHRNATATPVETIYLDDAIEATSLEEILAPAGGGTGSGGAGGTGGTPSGGAGGTATAGSTSGGASAGGGAGGVSAGAGGQATGGLGMSGSAGQSTAGAGGATSAGASAGGATATAGSSNVAGAASAGRASAGSPSIAGAPSSAGGATTAGSGSGVAGSSTTPATGDGDDGGCNVGGRSAPAWPLALIALGAALLRRRRR